jgi:hypothetical protein
VPLGVPFHNGIIFHRKWTFDYAHLRTMIRATRFSREPA